MTWFEATVESSAYVSASRAEIWVVVTDPVLLPRLTPLLSKIEVDGDLWRWRMMRIAALGVSLVPEFTEKMTFVEGKRLEYHHAPPKDRRERSGAEGAYCLTEIEGGTRLDITLTLRIDVPLPRVSGPAVSRIMKSTMTRTGERFSANLLKYLHARELHPHTSR